MRWTLAVACLLFVTACEENQDFQPPAGEQPPAATGDAPAPTGDGEAAPAAGGDDGAAPAGGDTEAANNPALGADGKPAVAAPTSSVRKFLEVKGTVTIDDKPAAVDMPIGDKSVIVTGDDGHAVVSVVAGSMIEIRAKSRIELGTSERKTNSWKIVTGALWSFLPSGTSFEAVTDNAVAGVRGTIFYVEKAPKSTYICDCNGEVEVYTGKVKKPVLFKSAHAHNAVRVFPKQSVKAKRENHSDPEMNELLKIVPEAAQL